LNISQSAVSQILKKLRSRLLEQWKEGAEEQLVEQVEQLYRIAKEAIHAWELSKQPPTPIPTPQPETTSPPLLAKERGQGGEVAEETPNASLPDTRHPIPDTLPSPGKISYLRTALQALAAVRSLMGLKHTIFPEDPYYDDNVKMLVGVDLDHMKYKDGTPVPRKEVDRILAPYQENAEI